MELPATCDLPAVPAGLAGGLPPGAAHGGAERDAAVGQRVELSGAPVPPQPSGRTRLLSYLWKPGTLVSMATLVKAVVGVAGVPQQETDSPPPASGGAAALGRAASVRRCFDLGPVGDAAELQRPRPLRPPPNQGHPLHPHPEVLLHTGEFQQQPPPQQRGSSSTPCLCP